MIEYKTKEDFNYSNILKISDIQFFDRIIEENKIPCCMIEYSVKYDIMLYHKARELYQFESKTERRKFYKEILKRYR